MQLQYFWHYCHLLVTVQAVAIDSCLNTPSPPHSDCAIATILHFIKALESLIVLIKQFFCFDD
jgi:hypothetical protein